MPNKDEVKGTLDQMKGKLKKGVGRAIDDERLEQEGAVDEAAGNVREKAGAAKRKIGEAVRDVGDRIKK